MLKIPSLVQAHQIFAPSTLFVSIFLTACWPSRVAAQMPVNGQVFTEGLSIINAPAIGTQFTTPGTIPISVEVSGNGNLQFPALIPGSGLPTRYDGLSIFLVSSETNINVTVSSGPKLLTGENGSVRHLDFQIPPCVPTGLYNLTFYESSHINNNQYYTITPISISIEDNNSPGECSDILNVLEPQPQASFPLGQSPFLPGNQVLVQTSPPPGLTGFVTTVLLPVTRTVILSEGQLPSDIFSLLTMDPTVTTTVPIVLISTVTVTSSGDAPPPTAYITTQASTSTIMGGFPEDLSGFIPVNTALSTNSPSRFLWLWSAFFSYHLVVSLS